MGYYTQYTLEARNINETDAKRLDDILNERDLIKYVFWDKYYPWESPCIGLKWLGHYAHTWLRH